MGDFPASHVWLLNDYWSRNHATKIASLWALQGTWHWILDRQHEQQGAVYQPHSRARDQGRRCGKPSRFGTVTWHAFHLATTRLAAFDCPSPRPSTAPSLATLVSLAHLLRPLLLWQNLFLSIANFRMGGINIYKPSKSGGPLLIIYNYLYYWVYDIWVIISTNCCTQFGLTSGAGHRDHWTLQILCHPLPLIQPFILFWVPKFQKYIIYWYTLKIY
jgi:hypothetical protein